MSLTYKESGVDIERANRLVKKIKRYAQKTYLKDLKSGIGPFASLLKVDLKKFPEPFITATCDGVGTKILLCKETGNYKHIGYDLVAMNVNDLLCSFSKPLLFYDYVATGRINEKLIGEIVKGVSQACRISGCSLAGGETAEMPGAYSEDDIEIAGFAVGIASGKKLKKIPEPAEGDYIIGFPSSGFHSNGYSFLRKLFFEKLGKKVSDIFPAEKRNIGEILLKPTKIYSRVALGLMEKHCVSAFAHITGGGIPENLARVIPDGLCAEVSMSSWKIPKIFRTVQELSRATDEEMFRTFNMGIGFIAIVGSKKLKRAEIFLKNLKEKFYVIGELKRGKIKVELK